MKSELKLPERNSKFKLSGFWQTEVDEFHDGNFRFLSAKKVPTLVCDELLELIESYDEQGWIISTYCYNNNSYIKLFLCNYKPKPWMNSYQIKSLLAHSNNCDTFSLSMTIDEFIDYMDLINPS